MHPKIQRLLKCIDLEEKEQSVRYRLDEQHTLKSLKAEGLAMHPIIVTRKSFGFADYPEISFKIDFPPENNLFKDGASIECFIAGEEPVKALLLNLEGKKGEFRLFAPDFPDWIEDDGVGIKLAPDTRTTAIMKKVLNELINNKPIYKLFEKLNQSQQENGNNSSTTNSPVHFHNRNLNESQQQAVKEILGNEQLTIIHGPPGTGKTTTLIEAIIQLVNKGEKVLVSAPSNTAVDTIAKGLLQQHVKLLRVGNTGKVDELVFAHTPEGKLQNSKQQKEIKQLKQRAEEFRRMALKYKRSFGKAEREQRQLLFKEVKNLRSEIKKVQTYNQEKLFDEASVIAGTPIGIYDAGIEQRHFSTLVLDEAGQCLEPLAWCIIPLADNVVLAGDHWQLPPTVLSFEAVKLGFDQSILQTAIQSSTAVHLLNVQYRMKKTIAGFSNSYFYDGKLLNAPHLEDTGFHLTFIDTAGSGFNEEQGAAGSSLQNKGELEIVRNILETENLDATQTAFISPYSGQVEAAKSELQKPIRISTIDSFQGQEKENIILSLVRSNEDGEIGFLKDYRRMNVAITRAKEQLFIIGDSSTIASDNFYKTFLTYIEKHGTYRTVWELGML